MNHIPSRFLDDDTMAEWEALLCRVDPPMTDAQIKIIEAKQRERTSNTRKCNKIKGSV